MDTIPILKPQKGGITTIDHDISRFTMSIMIVAWASSPWKHGQDGRATVVQISCERWLSILNLKFEISNLKFSLNLKSQI